MRLRAEVERPAISGAHRDTIASWLELYEDGGLEGPNEVGELGPDLGQQSIPSEVMEKFKKRLFEPERPVRLFCL
ncbi:hypothetical protein GGP42_001624 [Salinibacter ruber]|nr:hypothetical protein [Salinibacter ruber]